MPATLTYRPLTPQNRSKVLRGGLALRRPQNPLMGILPTCGNVLGYRYASLDEAQRCGNSHTDYCPLITIRWTHTFSAKEKDSETGLSYFGARYYSSDLSIWLSVDPQASKYPSLSPYVYCANNPIKLVDPNGEEIDGPDDPPTKYIIKKGDTFWDLENARNLPHGTIQKDNPTVDPNNLQVGQVIYYPYLLGDLLVHDDEIAVNSDVPDYFYQPTSFGITMNLKNYNLLSPFLSLYNLGESFHNLSSFTYFLKTNLFNRKFGFRTPPLLRPLGKGHTGRFTPNDLTENLAMKHIQGNPQMGRVIKPNLHDPRWDFSLRRALPMDPSGNGGGFVFDCRALPNPGREPQYRAFTGQDECVIEYLERYPEVQAFKDHTFALVDQAVRNYLERKFNHLMVCFGCTGGQHRSVYFAEQTARHLRKMFPDIQVEVRHTARENG